MTDSETTATLAQTIADKIVSYLTRFTGDAELITMREEDGTFIRKQQLPISPFYAALDLGPVKISVTRVAKNALFNHREWVANIVMRDFAMNCRAWVARGEHVIVGDVAVCPIPESPSYVQLFVVVPILCNFTPGGEHWAFHEMQSLQIRRLDEDANVSDAIENGLLKPTIEIIAA